MCERGSERELLVGDDGFIVGVIRVWLVRADVYDDENVSGKGDGEAGHGDFVRRHPDDVSAVICVEDGVGWYGAGHPSMLADFQSIQ